MIAILGLLTLSILSVGGLLYEKKIPHQPEGQWALSDRYMEAESARLGLGLFLTRNVRRSKSYKLSTAGDP